MSASSPRSSLGVSVLNFRRNLNQRWCFYSSYPNHITLSFSDANITAITEVSPDCKQYVVEVDEETFEGQAGQHTVLRTPAGVKPYSVLVCDGPRAALMIRAYGTDGVADYMNDREVGDTIQIQSKLTGSLTLNPPTRPAVFIGTGTGITPLIGLLHRYVTQDGPHAIFMFGEKNRDQLLYKEMLEQYELIHPVELKLAVSREDWHGRTGYIQEQLPEVISNIGTDADFYVCGVPKAVVAAKDKLDELDVSSADIHTEGWEDAQVAD